MVDCIPPTDGGIRTSNLYRDPKRAPRIDRSCGLDTDVAPFEIAARIAIKHVSYFSSCFVFVFFLFLFFLSFFVLHTAWH